MSPEETNWLPALLILGSALLAGAWAAFKSARHTAAGNDPTPKASSEVDGLNARLADLIVQLRQLEDSRTSYDGDTYRREKRRLENDAARCMEERDQLAGGPKRVLSTPSHAAPAEAAPAASRPEAEAAVAGSPVGTAPAPNSQMRGFAWGVGAVAIPVLIFYLMTQQTADRVGDMSLTGNAQTVPTGQEHSSEAIALRKYLADRPDDVEAANRLAHLLLTQDTAEARKVTEGVLATKPEDRESLVHRAVLVAAGGQPEAGLKQLAMLVEKYPDFAEAWLYHGMIAMRAGDHATGSASLQAFVKYAPEGEERDHIQSILNNQGAPAAATGRPKRPGGMGAGPFADLEARLEKNPKDLEALLKLSHLLLRQQRLEEAAPLVKRSLELDPKNAEARTHQALVLHASAQAEEALKVLGAVLEADPKFAEAWFFQGMIYMQSGKPQLSQDSWRKFVEVAPDGPQKQRIKGFLAGDGLQMGP